MENTLISIATLLTALGGVEFVKFLFNRRQQCKSDEIATARSEFDLAKESIVFLQEQMNKNMLEIKELQDQVLRLTREKTQVESELALKRCEQRGCANRKPETGY